MATYHAIAATGLAIIGMLRDACPRSEFAGAQFDLYQTSNFQAPMEEGLSLYLYHVAPNATRRNLPPRVSPDGRRYRPPLPVDLHYLLTPWARTAEMQQRLLGWSMRELDDMAILPAGVLNHYVTETDTFRSDETVELVLESLSLQDIVNIWDVFKPNLQISVAYVARLIAIESQVQIPDAGLVQTREFVIEKALAR